MGSFRTEWGRFALAAVLAAVVLAMPGCGKDDKKGSAQPAAAPAGSQGCITPEPGGRLCGEDAVDWCRAHPGETPKVQGNCDEILGKSSTDPQNKSSTRTPDEQNPPPYDPGSSGSTPPPSEQTQAPPSSDGGGSGATDQGHTQQYRCEEADAPDKYEEGCQGTLVPIG